MFILERVKPEDKEEILSFTKDTWDWGDYIPYIFDEWIESENGDFIKAVLNTKVVGISHIGYLSSWEAWLE
ncbi:MAG: GNAT family N-acetyltransferase, partial [bacterium]